jgi:hypothetical protein
MAAGAAMSARGTPQAQRNGRARSRPDFISGRYLSRKRITHGPQVFPDVRRHAATHVRLVPSLRDLRRSWTTTQQVACSQQTALTVSDVTT